MIEKSRKEKTFVLFFVKRISIGEFTKESCELKASALF